MPPPFGTGSPSSTTRGLYSLLENDPEQWASTTPQSATAPTRARSPKPRLESCRPIRSPTPLWQPPPGWPGDAPVCARTHRALAAAIGSLPPHIAVRSRQEWGWFVPRSRKTKQFCARTGGPSLRRKSASTPSVRVAHIALTAIARAGLSITCPALSVILVIGWRLIEVALGR